MSEGNDQDAAKGRLSLRPSGRMELGRTVDAGSVRQSFSHGRSKVVQVEVRKKRAPGAGGAAGALPSAAAGAPSAATRPAPGPVGRPPAGAGRALTATELAARQRALAEQQREAAKREAERREQEKISILSAAEEARRREDEARRAAEEEVRQKAEAEARERTEQEARRIAEAAAAAQAAAANAGTSVRGAEDRRAARPAGRPAPTAPPATAGETLRLKAPRPGDDDDEGRPVRRAGAAPGLAARKPQLPAAKKGVDDRRRGAKIDVQAAIEGEDDRVRSLASVRRQRERERRQAELERLRSDQVKVVREVVLPDSITVQELANRIAARAARRDQDADAARRDGDHHAEPGRRHRRTGGAGIRPPRQARLRGRCGAWAGRRERCRGRTAGASAGGDRDGPCRSRQDVAAGCAALDRRGGRRGRRHHAAYRRLPGGTRVRRPHHVHRHAGSRRVHRHARARRQRDRHRGAGGRGRRRRDAADHRGDPATPRRPTRRSSSPSTRWTSRTPTPRGCARNCSATTSWSRRWAARRRTWRCRRPSGPASTSCRRRSCCRRKSSTCARTRTARPKAR